MIFRRAARRSLATVLFTDIVDSTARAAELGDRRWRDLLARHNELIRRQLRHFHGREVDTAGDGFFATFPQPADAVRCAAAIIGEVRPLGLAIRAGVHTGETEVLGPKVAGIAVVIGSRIAQAAGSGEILVSRTVRDLVSGSELAFEPLGSRPLKGVPGEWELFRLVVPEVEEPAEPEVPPSAIVPAGRERLRRRVLSAAVAGGVGAAALAALILALPVFRGPAIPPGPNTVVAYDDGWSAVRVASVSNPELVAYDGTFLWVTRPEAKNLVRLDLNDLSDVEQVGQSAPPTALAYGEGALFVAQRFAGGLWRIEPRTAQSLPLPIETPLEDLVVAFGSVWGTDDLGRQILRVNPSTGVIEDTIQLPDGSVPGAIAAGRDAVWVANVGTESVARIDPVTAEVSGRGLALGSVPDQLAYDVETGRLWVLSTADDLVYIADAAATPSLRNRVDVCDGPSAVWVEGGEAWVACGQARQVWRIGADGSVLEQRTVPGVPADLVRIDGRLWVTLRVD